MTSLILTVELNPHDVDGLLKLMIPFAQHLLEEHDTWPPFGASVSGGQEVAMAMTDFEDKLPSSREILEQVTAGMKEQILRKEIEAAAICYAVQIRAAVGDEAANAIKVHWEQWEKRVDIFVPYQKIAGRYQYGKPVVQATNQRLFYSDVD